MSCSSVLGPGLTATGTLIQVGNGISPETMQTIANATDLTLPVKTDIVDVTAFCDQWHRRIPTLNDMGTIAFKVYWEPEEPTHRNSANGGTVGAGLRFLLVQRLLRDYSFVYPDGNAATDSFPAYVTMFSITAKVGGVYEASVELANSGAPQLV